MFAIYNKHNNDLYNKLVELSRNIFFYKELCMKDIFETRIILIFIHFSCILISFKKQFLVTCFISKICETDESIFSTKTNLLLPHPNPNPRTDGTLMEPQMNSTGTLLQHQWYTNGTLMEH